MATENKIGIAAAVLLGVVTALAQRQPSRPALTTSDSVFLQQVSARPQTGDEVPVTDGSSGPCSIDFSVTDPDGKPVYAARIDVHLAYGAFGAHKLDMGVYSNAAGKARFTGIPAKVKNPPIEFHAKKDDLVGLATMDPASECHAKHDIVMDKQKTQ